MKPWVTAAGFFSVLLVLAVVDASLTENNVPEPETPPPQPPPVEGAPDAPLPEEAPAPELPAQSRPDVLAILDMQGITAEGTNELSLLRRVVPPGFPVETRVLLREGDRLGLLSWTETPDAEVFFLSLKEALHESFSPEVRDLLDGVLEREGKLPSFTLTFLDPTISSERITFLRNGQRLYELRITEGREDIGTALVDALSE